MAKKNNIPEVDIIVDEEKGVIREVIPEKKLRSKKGHELRVNVAIYVILIVMSVIWLCPFVFLVFQSFRSWDPAVENAAGGIAGGMAPYLLPKVWSLDNYKYLFTGVRYDPMLLFKDSGATLLTLTMIGASVGAAGVFVGNKKQFGYLTLGLSALCLLIEPAWGIQIQLLCLVGLAGVAKLLWNADVKKTALMAAASCGVLCLRYLPTISLGGSIIWVLALGAVGGLIFLMNKMIERPNPKVSLVILGLLSVVLAIRSIDSTHCEFVRWFINTLTIAGFCAVIQTIMQLSVSYTLSRMRFKGRKMLMNVCLVLGMFPGFLTMIVLYYLLKMLGLTEANAVPGLILISCASSGMGYYISKGFFDTIPKSLDESARIDGATRFQVFLKIIMPMAKPIVIYTILMAFMGPWGDYVFASYVAFKTPSSYNVAVGLYQWVNTNDYQGYFTRFCAGGVLVAIPITVLFMCLQKYYVEGVTGGAVKG